ncbi:MAG TPA: TolC family protein [Candidatus Sulfotelmatobacter sp.]|nr:TolC family protein [Candidatus Sulfotelmatobacter sp.]
MAQQPLNPSPAPLTVTLQDALNLARKNSSTYHAAITDAAVAHEDKVQARAALLPGVSYSTQYLYTEGNGEHRNAPSFVANNFVHEYIAQGNGHENINLAGGLISDYRRATAAEALAQARREIANRGLVVTVVQNFYGLIVAQRYYSNAQQAAAESEHFLNLSQKLENGGEVAHSDVVKAQIQYNSTSRDLQEASLAMEKARLDLSVLIFPTFNENFSAVDGLELPEPLPGIEEARTMAARNNPELHAATAALQLARHEAQSAWAAHFPTLTLDVWYGIDSPHFASSMDRVSNLGYSAAATLNVPIFNWGATQSKVKQAELRKRQSEVELSAAQREAIANFRNFYAEAQTARAELNSLRQSAELASDSLRLTNLRYQAGEATALEVVDAQNTLVQAKNAYDQGQSRYRIAVATLQTLTGAF